MRRCVAWLVPKIKMLEHPWETNNLGLRVNEPLFSDFLLKEFEQGARRGITRW